MGSVRLCVQTKHPPLTASNVLPEHAGLSYLHPRSLRPCDLIRLPADTLFKGLNSRRGNPIGLKGTLGSRLTHSQVRLRGKNCVSMGDPVSVKDRGELRVFDSGDDLAASLANFVAALSDAAVKDRGAFSVVLSGGSLINALRCGCAMGVQDLQPAGAPVLHNFFAGGCSTAGVACGTEAPVKLTEPPYLNSVDWARWHVFWADERVVAKSHPDSNYKLANDSFLCKVPIVPSHVYSINDSLSVEVAAEDYETGLRQLVKTGIIDLSRSNDYPKFDLILLGMGPDGHIASLFPDHPPINEKEKWIAFITDSPKPPAERITFTLPVINSAASIVVVVTGAGKADTLRTVLGEKPQHDLLPAQMISPKDGKLTWFADKEAASLLDGIEIVSTGSI